MQTTTYYQNTGGTGCTTAAAVHAITQARAGGKVWLHTHDAHALAGALAVPLGSIEDPDADALDVAPGSIILTAGPTPPAVPTGTDALVIDAGRLDPLRVGRLVLTVRGPSYGDLRAATRDGTTPDRVLILAEPGRSLCAGDVADILPVPAVHVFEVGADPAVARALDAGLLTSRVPRHYARLSAALAGDLVRAPGA